MKGQRLRSRLFFIAVFLSLVLITAVSASAAEPDQNYGFSRLTGGEQSFYRALSAAAAAFSSSGKDVSARQEYEVAALPFRSDGITAADAIRVWKIFFVENPRYYWLSNRVAVRNDRLRLYCYEDYASANVRAAEDAAVKAGLQLLLSSVDGVTGEAEIARILHDELILAAGYAYEEDGETPSDAAWAHNIVGALTGRGAVCDGFAKAYRLLLSEKGIDCIFVDGTAAGGSHAWNLFRAAGEWYWADVTWDSQLSEQRRYAYFGTADAAFRADHTANGPSGEGAEYLYELPAAAEAGLPVITVYENGDRKAIRTGMESALDQVTDPQAEYRLSLFYDGRSPRMYKLSGGILPAAAQLTFAGDPSANGQELRIQSDLAASGAVAFSDLRLTLPEDDRMDFRWTAIRMQGYPLDLSGRVFAAEARCNSQGARIGAFDLQNAEGGTVTVSAETAEWNGRVNTELLILKGGHFRLGAGESRIVGLIFSEGTGALQLSDEPNASQRLEVERIYTTRAGTVFFTVTRPGDRLHIGDIRGAEPISIVLETDDFTAAPQVELAGVSEPEMEYTVKNTVSETAFADWVDFDGQFLYAPSVDPKRVSVVFVSGGKTVSDPPMISRNAEGYFCADERLIRKLSEAGAADGPSPSGTGCTGEGGEHRFGPWSTALAGSCYREGISRRTCSVCGASETAVIPMRAHTYGAWTLTRAAGIGRTGEKTRSCTVCGHTETEELPALTPKPTATKKPESDPTVSASPTPPPTESPEPAPSVRENDASRPDDPPEETKKPKTVYQIAAIVALCAAAALLSGLALRERKK